VIVNNRGEWVDYEERLRRVVAYIHDHLEEQIDFAILVEVACLSPYHWHRIYRAIKGETITTTVRRLRLHHAAGRLANSAIEIEDIARRAGFGSVQAFTRAFTAAFNMPPAEFRRSGSHMQFRQPDGERAMSDYPVEIRTLSAMRLATISHTGSYMEIGRAFDQLFAWFGSRGLMREGMIAAGVFFDDPDSVPEEELRSLAGMEVAGDFAIEEPLAEFRTYGGPLCGADP
jgi:AraC family transcriptional regulator